MILRVTVEGDAPWECTAAEFIEDNPELAEEVMALRVEGRMVLGGGAEPLSIVTRVS